MDLKIYKRRQLVNRMGLTLSMSAMGLGLFVLLWILFVLLSNGLAALDWAMFTQSTPAPGSEGGGLANAIVGDGFCQHADRHLRRGVPCRIR
jgi:phosphate transport system permease protein